MSSTELNKQPEYFDHVLTIKQFFNRHRHGGYMFAVSYSYALKTEVNREVIAYCKEQRLVVGEAQIKFELNESPIQQLNKAKGIFHNGLILTNIDELMLATQNEFAYQLNQMREALFALHTPVLIWLTPENHSAFTHKAIDLYTRRDLDTLFFPEIKTEDTNHLVERSEMKLEQSEDAETLRTRIVLLEKQLQSAREDAEIPRSRIANEIVLPLIKAYGQLLILPQAVNLVNEFKNDFKKDDREMLIECGKLYHQSGDLDNAIDCFEKALQIDINFFGEESAKVGFDYNELGLTWHDKGDLDKAISYFEQSLTINLELVGDGTSSAAIRYNNLGLAWHEKDDLNKAISYFDKALAIGLKLFGEENPKVAVYYNNLGIAWKDKGKGDLDKAISYFGKALAIGLKLFGEENPNVAVYYNNLGGAWRQKGEIEKAINYHEKSLVIDLKLFGEDNPNIANRYGNLGYAFQAKNEIQKAASYFQKAYNIFSKTYGPEHHYTKQMQEEIASIENSKIKTLT